MASLIQDMLKTPEQLRQERFAKLREDSRAQAQLLGATGTTALPGLLSGLAAQELVASAADPAKMVQRGLLGAGQVVGSLPSSTTRLDGTVTPIDVRSMTTGTPRDLTTTTATNRMKELGSVIQQASMTPEERQAAQVSAIAQQAGSKDVERLRKLADQLRAVGRPDAAEQYDERATKLETEAVQQLQSSRIADVLDQMGRTDLAGLVRSGQAEPLEALKEARLGEEKPEKPRARKVLTENARMPFEIAYNDSEVLQQQLELAAEESEKNLSWWERNAPELLGGAPSTDDKVTRLKEIIFEEALQIVDENINPQQALEQATQKVLGTISTGGSAQPSGNWVLEDGQWVQK